MEQTILRPTAEQRYADELAALRRWDVGNPKPENWQLSPRAVRLFLLGTEEDRPWRWTGRVYPFGKNTMAMTRW